MAAGSGESFEMLPAFMALVTGEQQAAFSAITSAYGTVTPAQLGMFATAMGPLGVANYTPAFFEATFNNVTSGLLTAINHSLLGVSTAAAQAGYVAVDSATSAAGGAV